MANLEVLAMKSIANAATRIHVHTIKYGRNNSITDLIIAIIVYERSGPIHHESITVKIFIWLKLQKFGPAKLSLFTV